MEYALFQEKINVSKAAEEAGDFDLGQRNYDQLSTSSLTKEQRAILAVGRATCYLRMQAPQSALLCLEFADLENIDPSAAAYFQAVLSQSLHEVQRFSEAFQAATSGEAYARVAGESASDILGENIARQGFSLVEMGLHAEGRSQLDRALKYPLEQSVLNSVKAYRLSYSN
jgi:hypothetical protein